MEFENEKAVKQALQIKTWRNLSKDKFLSFTELLPSVDKEVALKIIGQFPNFKELATDSLNVLGEQVDRVLNSVDKSQEAVFAAYEEERAVLIGLLGSKELSLESRFEVMDRIRIVNEQVSIKDSEHKSFAKDVLVTVAKVVLALGAIGLAIATAGRINFLKK